jgi:hypothetical protein
MIPIHKIKEMSFITSYDDFNITESEKSIYKIDKIDNLQFYLIEKLGNNSIIDKYAKTIFDYIKGHLIKGNKKDMLVMPLIIKELGITNINILFTDDNTSIIKNGDNLELNISNNTSLTDILPEIDHELQHIYINEMGNITKKDYFITNDLIQRTSGRTKAFLTLYYLSFKDEMSANIHMFHRQIGINKIKTNKQFKDFVVNSDLYSICIKMINIDVLRYWQEVVREGYEDLLIKEFNITNLDSFLTKISEQIKISGEVYKKKLSKSFLN